MSVLTDQTTAFIDSKVTDMMGTIASTPSLLVTQRGALVAAPQKGQPATQNGVTPAVITNAQTWACNVNITNFDSTGTINQWKRNMQGLPQDTPTFWNSNDFNIEETLYAGFTLYNVPIASNNGALLYAAIGTPVNLHRTPGGTWAITGLAEPQVGTYTMIPVNLGIGSIGAIATPFTMTTLNQFLTLGQIGGIVGSTLVPPGNFGITPFGSFGVFVNGKLLSIGT